MTVPIGREPDEWIGATPDTPVLDRVKLRVFRRFEGKCYLTGHKIRPGDAWHIEHRIPLAIDPKGNRERNLAPALVDAHKIKTREDRGIIAKVDRIARKNAGLWPKSKRPIQSRGFERSRG